MEARGRRRKAKNVNPAHIPRMDRKTRREILELLGEMGAVTSGVAVLVSVWAGGNSRTPALPLPTAIGGDDRPYAAGPSVPSVGSVTPEASSFMPGAAGKTS